MPINDAIITDPNDELYHLQAKYNVRISRSNKSDAIYFFRKTSYKVRIGHPISKNQNHLRNFENVPIRGKKITADLVEEIIKLYLHKL